VTDTHDDHDKPLINDRIYDAIVTDADTPKIMSTAELDHAGRTRVTAQRADPLQDARAVAGLDAVELLESVALPLDRLTHCSSGYAARSLA
jgi:hypothetical protein